MKTQIKPLLIISTIAIAFLTTSPVNADNLSKTNHYQPITKGQRITLPREQREERLINALKKTPDLIPIVDQFDGQGIIKVRNIGNKKSAKSYLKLDCDHQDKSQCPDISKSDMAQYSAPGYSQDFMVRIPQLNPGQSYSHRLSFWSRMIWGPGRYVISFKADATNTNTELNERNNIGQYTLSR